MSNGLLGLAPALLADAHARAPAAAAPSAPNELLWLIPALPLLGAALILVFGKWLKGLAHWPCVLGAAGACVLSVIAFTQVNAESAHGPLQTSRLTWFAAGDVDVSIMLQADGLTAVMLVMVTF